jgi:hypothetical protein
MVTTSPRHESVGKRSRNKAGVTWGVIVLLGMCVGGLAGFVGRTMAPATYESSMTFYISVRPDSGLEMTNTAQLIELRAASYAGVAESHRIVDAVAQRLGVDQEDPFVFTATPRSGTSLLDVTATSLDGDLAVASLEELTGFLPAEVNRMDGGTAETNPIQLSLADPPSDAEEEQSRAEVSALGALAGAVVAGAAYYGYRYRSRGD